ncbi:MAG: LysM peptidoglycan-binding domain-containing protein [Anaerolineales bacterium]|nr:LysM peptidoglycan-binding domain-containing protein [Anaerolineales bacterium]
MKKITYPLILFVLLSAMLASCSLFGASTAETQSALPLPQATNTTPTDKVTVELSSQVDTTVQYNAVGQIMKFKFIVKMIKNDLADNTPPNLTFIGLTPVCPAINTIGNLNDRFDTGEIIECTFDYILTQADLDKGSVSANVSATVYTVSSNQVTTTVPTIPSKLLSLTRSAEPTTYNTAGQTVTFTYIIKNSGAAPIGPAQFTIADSGINNNTPFNCGNADASIAVGATLTCTSTYTVTSADISAATVTTNAVASGGGANSTQPVPVTLTKGAAPTTASGTSVQHTVIDGEWLWQIARCYGADPAKTVAANPQLANPAQIKPGIVVTVPNVGSNGTVHAPPQPCVTKHVVQSGDTWTTIATKYGSDPGLTQMVNANTLTVGKEVKVPLYTAGLNLPLSSSTTPVTPTTPTTASLTLTATTNPTTYSQAGQVITISYVIKNSGTASLGPAQFTVTDPLIGATPINCGPANTTLAAGTTVNCTSTYTITPTDLNSASVSTKPTAAGGGAAPSTSVDVTILKSVSALTVTSSPSQATYNQAGQVITFNYVVKNSGTTPLGPAQFIVTDILMGLTPINCGAADTTLAPNATVSCSANYTVTQADLGVASISNSATATGGGVTSQPDSKSVIKQ